jgi:signal-transduction protein with cAMP-binding, CBS, and nucleotidyltransferase domain
MSYMEFLKKIEIFKGLNTSQLSDILHFCSEVKFQKDDKIFSEGEIASRLWIVVEGRADIRFDVPGHPSSKLHTIEAIDDDNTEARTLGWSCFVPPYKYRLSAYCVSDKCLMLYIEKDKISAFFDKNKDVGYLVMANLVKITGYRFDKLQDKVATVMGDDLMGEW